jgi:hypothetical protein
LVPGLFSNLGLDVVQISAGFLLVTALVLGDKTGRRFLTNFMHTVFALQCVLVIVFRDGAWPKLFAALMLLATLIIRVVHSRRTPTASKRLSA